MKSFFKNIIHFIVFFKINVEYLVFIMKDQGLSYRVRKTITQDNSGQTRFPWLAELAAGTNILHSCLGPKPLLGHTYIFIYLEHSGATLGQLCWLAPFDRVNITQPLSRNTCLDKVTSSATYRWATKTSYARPYVRSHHIANTCAARRGSWLGFLEVSRHQWDARVQWLGVTDWATISEHPNFWLLHWVLF